MVLTLFMFFPFIATFAFASWDGSSNEVRSRDRLRNSDSLCRG